jgi:hypothetical protein
MSFWNSTQGVSPRFGHMSLTRNMPMVSPPALPPTQTETLHESFPNDHARPIDPGPFSLILPNTTQALATLAKVAPKTPAKDPEMANLENNLKLGSSFLIATLATWGLKQRILGVGEFLGFASWFGAMALTPKVINTMVKLKTNANLSQMYASTYGERKNLYTDPNYLPLQLIPDEEIMRVADRLKIPEGPDRRRKTEEKLRQISVQSRTWWMLVAGPATPVLSGLICDLLQDPLTRRINNLRFALGMRQAQRKGSQPSAKLAQRVEKNIDRVVGDLPDSMLTAWWKDFGRGMLHSTGLRKVFSLREATDGTPEFQLQKMVEFFEKNQRDPNRLDTIDRYLDWRTEQLKKLEQRSLEALEPFEKRLPAENAQQLHRFIRRRISNALNTIAHYRTLIGALRAGGQSAEDIRILMEKPVLSEVQRLYDNGYSAEAQRLAGSPENYRQIIRRLNKRQYKDAYVEMGISIDLHLREALKASSLRSLWRKRMPVGLGGGLLLASALYTALFVGRDFKPKEETP